MCNAGSSQGISHKKLRRAGFTLVEMMVAMAVTLLLMTVLLTTLSQTASIWQRTRERVGSYQSARFAFDLIRKTLSQATMNVYSGYDNDTTPTAYLRKSDLNFVIATPPRSDFGQGNAVFFQAPLGITADANSTTPLPALLNATGYFLDYGKDPDLPSNLAALDRNRFLLKQYRAPSETMSVFTDKTGDTWFKQDIADGKNLSVIAQNVILMLFWPRLPEEEDTTGNALSENFLYNSRSGANVVPQPLTANQAPPLVQVTLVAVDEISMRRLSDAATPPTEIVSALQSLFRISTSDAYAADLGVLEARLNAAKIGYQVFTATIPIRESKWSKTQ